MIRSSGAQVIDVTHSSYGTHITARHRPPGAALACLRLMVETATELADRSRGCSMLGNTRLYIPDVLGNVDDRRWRWDADHLSDIRVVEIPVPKILVRHDDEVLDVGFAIASAARPVRYYVAAVQLARAGVCGAAADALLAVRHGPTRPIYLTPVQEHTIQRSFRATELTALLECGGAA